MDGGAEQGKVLGEDLQNGGQQIHLQMVVAAEFKGDDRRVVFQPPLGGQSCFQDQMGIGQKEKAFLGQGNILAGPVEELDL